MHFIVHMSERPEMSFQNQVLPFASQRPQKCLVCREINYLQLNGDMPVEPRVMEWRERPELLAQSLDRKGLSEVEKLRPFQAQVWLRPRAHAAWAFTPHPNFGKFGLHSPLNIPVNSSLSSAPDETSPPRAAAT